MSARRSGDSERADSDEKDRAKEVFKNVGAETLFFQCHPIDRDRYIPVRGQILTLRHGAQR